MNTSNNKKTLYILSHQGGSFVKKIIEAVDDVNCEVFVLSSQASESLLKSYRKPFKIIDNDALEFEQILKFINANISHENVGGFISVWEGYRPLMAKLNRYFGCSDITYEQAQTLRDKLTVRNLLHKEGLSNIFSELLNEQSANKCLLGGITSFIKPRYGLGSVGAKRLSSIDDLKYVERVRNMMQTDDLLKSSTDNFDFILEKYIDGNEFSAEIVFSNHTPNILAIHEKIEVCKGIFTTTEPFCISPPQTLIDTASVEAWLKGILNTFGVEYGCYHIEFKIQKCGSPELIEINPRLGGALIAESTVYVSGHNPITLWVKSILSQGIDHSTPLQMDSKRYRCSAFRVYFSQKAGKVKVIKTTHVNLPPNQCEILVNVGDLLCREDSEQFLGQAIWLSEKKNKEDMLKFQKDVQNLSKTYLQFKIGSTLSFVPKFLIVDYNLSRWKEVVTIAENVKHVYGLQSVLVTTHQKKLEHPDIYSITFDDLRSESYLAHCVETLNLNNIDIKAGVVFSDDAIVTGTMLLEYFGVLCDSSEGARRSFDKECYRRTEVDFAHSQLNIKIPKYISSQDLQDKGLAFYETNWIVKPRCEGNNRGVIRVTNVNELKEAIDLNVNSQDSELFAEECFPIQEEYSVDGVGKVSLITKKLVNRGKFPLEIGQILPAELTALKKEKILYAGKFSNTLCEQNIGAFHNEIAITGDGEDAFVVEPNRRPGGMAIWDLIKDSYGINFHMMWINSAFGYKTPFLNEPLATSRQGFLMLPGPPGLLVCENSILDKLDSVIARTWSSINVTNPPEHYGAELVSKTGDTLPEMLRNGHDFLLSVRFKHLMEFDLESALYAFYSAWENEMHSLQSTFTYEKNA